MTRILLIALAALFPLTVRAQLAIEGYYWLVTPSGDAAIGIDGVEGTDIDLEDDLGYGDEEGVPGASLWLGRTHQLGVSFFQLDISAKNNVDRSIKFEDLLFNVNTDVASTLEATVIQGYYKLNLGNDDVTGGLLLGGLYTDFSTSAAASAIGSAQADVEAGMPVIGAHLRIRATPWLGFRGQITGSTWEYDDVDATFIDAEGLVMLRSSAGIFAAAGYRHIGVEVEDKGEPLDIDLTFSGPTVVVGFEW